MDLQGKFGVGNAFIGLSLDDRVFQSDYYGSLFYRVKAIRTAGSTADWRFSALLIEKIIFIGWLLYNRNANIRRLVKRSIKSSKSIVAI